MTYPDIKEGMKVRIKTYDDGEKIPNRGSVGWVDEMYISMGKTGTIRGPINLKRGREGIYSFRVDFDDPTIARCIDRGTFRYSNEWIIIPDKVFLPEELFEL